MFIYVEEISEEIAVGSPAGFSTLSDQSHFVCHEGTASRSPTGLIQCDCSPFHPAQIPPVKTPGHRSFYPTMRESKDDGSQWEQV